MREAQIKVLWGIGFLLTMALGIVLVKPAQAAVTVTARPVIISRPAVSAPRVAPSTPRVAPSTPRTSGSSYRSMNGTTTSSPTFLPLYVPIFLNGGSEATGAEAVQVATPLLTKCTVEQFNQAKLWQQDCMNLDDVGHRYCPLLSYFRYCKEAQPDEVVNLVPAGKDYKHVFLIKE
ncbi:hypothetical protein D3C78_879130 [compost metagenome]